MTADRPRWVLLHGTPLDPGCWGEVSERLGSHGDVDVPAVAPQVGDTDLPGDIARRLADAYGDGAKDLDVVGHSFGGQIALELALALPQRVRTLTIVCSRATPFVPFAAVAEGLRAGAPVDVTASMTRWFVPDELAANGEVVRYARTTLEHADRVAWAAALDAIAGYEALDRIGAIDVPSTLLAAELDPVSTPEAMAETAAHLPGSTLDVLAGAAHMSPFVDADGLAGRIRAAAARASG